MAAKKLVRSSKNKILTGLLGGLGDYYNVDPTILRLVFLLIFVLTGFFPGVVFYFIAALIVPQK